MANNHGPERIPGTDVVAAMPKDDLRSLFYLFTGKPDSRIKVFSDAICLCKDDVVELNTCISRKLATHHIDATVTTVKVSYEGSQMSEFGTWAEFTAHHWQEPDCIEEVVIKWDFLVNVESFKAPQRHTLMLRISRDIKPARIIQMMAAGNSDEFDHADMVSSPAFCRVDFINAQISKELINEVADWYKGRKSPRLIPEHWYWFKKRRQGLAEIFDQWFILSWALLVSALLFWGSKAFFAGAPSLTIVGIAVFLAVYSLRPVTRVATRLARRVFRTLADLEGSRVVFQFTSGDKKRIDRLERENQKQGRTFLWTSIWNIGLNVLAAIIYTAVFVSSAPQQTVQGPTSPPSAEPRP